MSLETMTKLFSTTVGAGGTTSITFSNIPQGYTDLNIKFSSRISSNGEGYPVIRFNGDTSANYAWRNISSGNNSASASSATYINLYATPGTLYGTGSFGAIDLHVSNYSDNTIKTVNAQSTTTQNSSTNYLALISGQWLNSSPVTTVTLTTQGANETFSQYTTATLYGVKNTEKTAGNSIKATGGNIVFDGTYVYHVFPTTGTFTPTQPIIADLLVVAGGGGGGQTNFGGYGVGAGGGAGGIKAASLQSLSASSYSVSVGAGGSGGGSSIGTAGTSSSIGGIGITTLTATGGSSSNSYSGGAGGADPSNAGGSGGTTSSSSSETYASGGGGGAGAVGGSWNSSTLSGSGGVGSSTYSSWTVATGYGQVVSGVGYLAGGGGGGYGRRSTSAAIGASGNGGYGGGGAGTNADNSSGVAGTANTGGGGGGAGTLNASTPTSGAGGSGVVIVRYKG